nr:putative ribonuclease H-like domain-containing protein [Tanacetum cinerariifolium]
FQVTIKASHLHVVKRIFRYLKGQPKLGLWYPKDSSFDLEVYSDSDYARANLDRKSTTRGCQFLGRRLISWQCKKQTIVATSTTEAEYVVATSYCWQVLWIQNQMLDYGFNFMNTKIYIDNESTICIVKNLVFHSKTKHIEIRHHFIRDAYEKKLIQVLKIHTDDNVADLLTKAFDVSRQKVSTVRPKLNTARSKFNNARPVFSKNEKFGEGAWSYTDKVKVINAKAEGISAAGETLNAATLTDGNELALVDLAKHKKGGMGKLKDKPTEPFKRVQQGRPCHRVWVYLGGDFSDWGSGNVRSVGVFKECVQGTCLGDVFRRWRSNLAD